MRTLCEQYSLGATGVFAQQVLLPANRPLLLPLGWVGPQELIAVTWTRRSNSADRIKTFKATARIDAERLVKLARSSRIGAELCARCRATSMANGNAQEAPAAARPGAVKQPTGVTSGRGPY